MRERRGVPRKALAQLVGHYDWRHLCLTNCLNRGTPPATVAMWAGNSVPVLLAIYVNVVDNEAVLLRQLEGMYDGVPPVAG